MDIIGTMPPDEYKFLCIVGSRTYSTYGKDACKKLILGLRGYPIVIVSGLAVGIDSIAHEAALEAGLKTISFPGSGLDPSVLYPSSKRYLAEQIIKSGGALISRFNQLQKSDIWTFPSRNRLMAGISHATLVIEGRHGSGTLGTAKYAEEFNRDVLAVPGPIDSELSYGPHMLIRRGATPITSSEDILEALGFTDTTRYDDEKRVPKKHSRSNRSTQLTINLDQISLSPDEKAICTLIKDESLSATELIEKTSLPVSLFNITVTELEMKGFVSEEGGRYRMIR